MLWPGVGRAADLGGNCCDDLEQRVSELEATAARAGGRKVKLVVSGQVNEAIMFWDDGVDHGRFFVSDAFERTRFRFAGEARINSTVSAGFLAEFGVRLVNAGGRSQLTPSGGGSPTIVEIRHSAWWLEGRDVGRLWVGHTSSATDGITEINLANVNADVLNVAQWIPGFSLRTGNGALSARTWNNITPGFRGFWVAGEGDRSNVVKYVSPTLAGFSLSAAWGEDDFWDAALRFAHQFQDVRVAAGIGYKQQNDNPGKTGSDGPACADLSSAAGGTSSVDCHSIGLSASILHVPTGLYVTGSWGKLVDENRKALYGGVAGVRDSDDHAYIQGGLERDWFGFGRTTAYAEFGRYRTGAGLTSIGGAATNFGVLQIQGGLGVLSGAEVEMRGLGLNQAIDAAAMDIYFAYRTFSADVSTSATGSQLGSARSPVQDFKSGMVGAIVRF